MPSFKFILKINASVLLAVGGVGTGVGTGGCGGGTPPPPPPPPQDPQSLEQVEHVSVPLHVLSPQAAIGGVTIGFTGQEKSAPVDGVLRATGLTGDTHQLYFASGVIVKVCEFAVVPFTQKSPLFKLLQFLLHVFDKLSKRRSYVRAPFELFQERVTVVPESEHVELRPATAVGGVSIELNVML